MKIAIITSFWNPPHFHGGISRVIFELRKCWINCGHTVHIYACDTVPDHSEGIFRIPIPPIPLRSVWINACIALAGKLKDYDIIFPQTGIGALFMDKEKCVPFIHTLSRVEHKTNWRIWRRAIAPLERYSLKSLPIYITFPGDANQGLLVDFAIPATKILLVNNGVDDDTFKPVDTLDCREFVVLAAGRFIPRKRFDLLIRSFAHFASSYKDVRLIIAGGGDLDTHLKNLTSKLDIASKVSFPGMVDESIMLKLYQSASVYVMSSIAEGMPMVVMEAQSCGVPVIAGDFDFARGIVLDEKTGLIVKGDDPVKWADALCRLYENESLRKALGIAAREHMIESFSWDQVANRIMTRFEMVLNTGLTSNSPGDF